MSNDREIQEHPAYRRASRSPWQSPSYYLQVLQQNLYHFYDQVPVDPCEVDEQEVLRGTTFMVEEAVEYNSAKTLEDKLDALVDIVIVALGRAVFHGFHNFDEAMSRVVGANMDKVPGPSPRRGEWSRDLSKPEGWRPADLRDLVQPQPIVSSESPGDEPLDDDEAEILEDFLRRRYCPVDPHLETTKTREQKENLAARVITSLRERVSNITTEKDNIRAQRDAAWAERDRNKQQLQDEISRIPELQRDSLAAKVITDLHGKVRELTIDRDTKQLERNAFREERNAARAERDDYQRQLRDEIGRCHELRGSNHNLRTWAKSLGRVVDETVDAREIHEMEKPPIELDEIHPVLLECAQLLNRKGQDYGNQDHTKERYHPLGHHSYIQMMHNKMTRIRRTALELKPGQTLNYDSVRDSVLDLINYSAFYGAWLEEQENTDD